MRYTALTSSGPFDIGEFDDQPTAEAWAVERYGEDLQAVMAQQQDSVTVTADPIVTGGGAILAGALVLFALSTLSKSRRKKR